ncbi:MAG: hypothetical protein SGPRY_011299 [Prymnesium sp.]
MVCDFFYPSMGGVENHVHQLSQSLLKLGHKVVVLTHKYGSRSGVRWLAAGLKVYHIPFEPFHDRVLPPTGLLLLPLFRDILLRERITLIHSHAVCTMALECASLAATMGYHVVYTEHSNFGFSDSADIHINKICRFVLSQALPLLSFCLASPRGEGKGKEGREGSCLAQPRQADSCLAQPPSSRVRQTLLVWRKGTHLLVQLIPEVCRRFPYAHFIIGGDGPNRTAIEEVVERHQLHERVELLGAVVSTRVGGVPEILPPHMLLLTEPEPAALLEALSEVIPFASEHAAEREGGKASHPPPCVLAGKNPLPNFHQEVSKMYSWLQVNSIQTVLSTIICSPGTRVTMCCGSGCSAHRESL